MLSICIPTYRYDVRPLVAELLRQAEFVDPPVEILVYDDASPDDGDWGRAELRQTAGIRYVELETNLGRAAIRNKMAKEATHDYLVMLDADGWPNTNFVRHWIDSADETEQLPTSRPAVVVGGRNYAAGPPEKNEHNLHWWYGTHRESPSQKQRTDMGALGFQSNNFGVERELLLKYPFADAHQGYGHEDTLWGQQLARAGFYVAHIDNAVVHLGLEHNDVFLQKQKQAINNLRLLKNESPHLRTRLIDLVEQFPFLPTLANLVPEQILVDYLTGREKPNLYALDLLKLRWWRT